MSWIREDNQSFVYRFCNNVLRAGNIPCHVAFIMDGNRRFARKRNYAHAQGHLLGFDKLSQALEWCLDLGILQVTVYAFSIENFKRSKEEVDGLMEMAREKFSRLLQERDFLDKNGVRVCVLGNISLLPTDIQELMAEGTEMTKHNDRAVLNVCVAYTSRDEMCSAMKDVAEGVSRQLLHTSDVSESLLEQCFYSDHPDPPDLLIRTSGEVRLSDFLLWQSTFSVLSFIPVLWPEFSRWHLYAGLLHYQMNVPAVQKARSENIERRLRQQMEVDIQIVENEHQSSTSSSTSTSAPGLSTVTSEKPLSEKLRECHEARDRRIATFLEFIRRRRDEHIASILATRQQSLTT